MDSCNRGERAVLIEPENLLVIRDVRIPAIASDRSEQQSRP